MKPFFLPLLKKHYLEFSEGTKRTEYRLEKGAYNENQIFVGREIIISNGYTKLGRLKGIITKVYRSKLISKTDSFVAIYGNCKEAFCFDIQLI